MPSPTPTNLIEVTNREHIRRRAAGRHVAAPSGLAARVAATGRALWRSVRHRLAVHRVDPADRLVDLVLSSVRAGHGVVLVLGPVTA
jgi:hypothetical protein